MHVVIIGNGISGITAARWIRKRGNDQITVISSESSHFFSRTALMYLYMGHMRTQDIKPYEDWFWKKNRIDLLKDHVDSIAFAEKRLDMSSGKTVQYDKLILALGSKPNKFGWPGQDLDGVGGLYHMQDLEYMEKYSPDLRHAVIVGGGLIGIEMAEMFRTRNIDVTLLIRESSYWNNVLPPEESAMISKHIIEHHIDLRTNVNLGEIIDDGSGRANGVIIKETQEKIDCGFVGLTAGVSPNVQFLKDTELDINRGIVVNNLLETSVKDVYAIGDCAELSNPRPGRRSVEAVWYTGRMMGETVAYTVTGSPVAYDPGIWFNSAKFLDIEYQVYGDIPNKTPEDQNSLFWKHPTEHKSIRINYTNDSNKVTGFNLMGIRFRHEVCERWIKDETTIEEVLKNLALANFDPEFYITYERDIISKYESLTGKKIQLKKQKGLNAVLAFLRK